MSIPAIPPFRLAEITVDPLAGTLVGPAGETRVEPKVMDLLVVLAEADGQVVSREALFDRLWPEVTVGEDTLTRAVFKLRKALGDDPKAPDFVATVPKRGYRLLVAPEPLAAKAIPAQTERWPYITAAAAALIAALGVAFVVGSRPAPEPSLAVERATDRYMRFTRQDNEAAIDLYQRALDDAPDPAAEAGLAAALVQRVVRWPDTIGSQAEGVASLESALASGLTTTPEAEATLLRARQLAERAVRGRGSDPDAWRVLGLVRTAQGDLDGALEAYDRGLRLDPNNWAVRINLAELQEMRGDPATAYETLTAAYEAMGDAYLSEPQRVGLWRAPLGALIAEKNREAGRIEAAERWYRRTLSDEPLHRETTAGLASLLMENARPAEAEALCEDYVRRTREASPCASS